MEMPGVGVTAVFPAAVCEERMNEGSAVSAATGRTIAIETTMLLLLLPPGTESLQQKKPRPVEQRVGPGRAACRCHPPLHLKPGRERCWTSARVNTVPLAFPYPKCKLSQRLSPFHRFHVSDPSVKCPLTAPGSVPMLSSAVQQQLLSPHPERRLSGGLLLSRIKGCAAAESARCATPPPRDTDSS